MVDDSDKLTEEALTWFVRMKDDHVDARDRAAFDRWLNADPRHREALQRAQALWARFDVVKPEYQRMRASGRIGRRSVLLGGLVVAAATLPAFHLLRGIFASPDYVTDIGERKTFKLADGSEIELGGASAVSVDFNADRRLLVLHRGQAFFRVAADRSRAFIVEAAGGRTTARGTAFDIRILDNHVTVSVVEHTVEVAIASAAPVSLDAGWQVSYEDARMEPPVEVDLSVVQSWRNDRLVFEDVPLRRVIAELDRYRPGYVIIADDSAGRIPVTAVFNVSQVKSALNTIEQILPVRVFNPEGHISVIYSR